jgi:hypothetical protein
MQDPNNELNTDPLTDVQSSDRELWEGVRDKVSEVLGTDAELDAEVVAAFAVAEINKCMEGLASAREYLSAEAERVKRETDRLKALSKTAVASVHAISENLRGWGANGERLDSTSSIALGSGHLETLAATARDALQPAGRQTPRPKKALQYPFQRSTGN